MTDPKGNLAFAKKVQALMIFLGYDDEDRLVADGDWGGVSVTCLEAFQKGEGLEVTGEMNEKTFRYMCDTQFTLPDDVEMTDKRRQAVLILSAFDGDGKLVADGNWGEVTQSVLRQYVDFGLRLGDDEEGQATFWVDDPDAPAEEQGKGDDPPAGDGAGDTK